MEKSKITKAVLGRLPRYLNLLKTLSDDGTMYISATRIARELSLGEVQVRKDLGVVCGKGKPKLGYLVSELTKSIENCLGHTNSTPAVLVGAGRLGRALLGYDEFESFGVHIAAAFDCDENTIRNYSHFGILPMSNFEEYCRSHDVKIGIITVGESAAQDVCDRMVASGINAIWNFAPCKLEIPKGTIFLQENLALSLAYLNNKLLEQSQKENDI